MRTSFLDHRVPPPVLMVAVALLMWLAAKYPPTLAGQGSTIDPTRPAAASALVVGGPFRFSRNPMYVGFTSMLLAWAAWLQSPWAFAGPVVFALYLTHWQIVPEERALRAKFGAAFNEYEAHVRRWL